jgi:hypothetical protein
MSGCPLRLPDGFSASVRYRYGIGTPVRDVFEDLLPVDLFHRAYDSVVVSRQVIIPAFIVPVVSPFS